MHVFIVILYFGSWISLLFPFLNIYIIWKMLLADIYIQKRNRVHCFQEPSKSTLHNYNMKDAVEFASWPNSFNLYKGFSYFQKVFGRIKLVMRTIILPLQRFLFIYVWKIGPRNVWNQAIHYDFFIKITSYWNFHAPLLKIRRGLIIIFC